MDERKEMQAKAVAESKGRMTRKHYSKEHQNENKLRKKVPKGKEFVPITSFAYFRNQLKGAIRRKNNTYK